MDDFCVRDLMVPISEYATVEVGTTMLDALLELRSVQFAHTDRKYLHRGILVLDDQHNVVGKISQLRVLKAVMPQGSKLADVDLHQFGFSSSFIQGMEINYRLGHKITNKDNLRAIANLRVEEFMQTPEPGEFVDEDASLDDAIYQLVSRTHLSLLVTRGGKIVGVLRMSDVFAALSQEIELCSRELHSEKG